MKFCLAVKMRWPQRPQTATTCLNQKRPPDGQSWRTGPHHCYHNCIQVDGSDLIMANTRHITIIIGLFTFLFTFTEFVYIFCFHHSSSHQRKDSSTSPAVTPPPSNKSALLTNPATLAHSREKAKRWVREQATRFLESYFKVCNFFIFVYFLTN